MNNVLIIENQPFEYSAHECNPIGHRLVDFLPVSWREIESGVQEQGVSVNAHNLENADDRSAEEIKAHFLATRGCYKFISMREDALKSLLCDFLTLCNSNKHYYTDTNFVRVMAVNGFNIPQFIYKAYDMYKKEEITSSPFTHSNLYNVKDTLSDIKDSPIIFGRKYNCVNDCDYYIAVVLEIIRQGKFIKKCEQCGRWFVTEKKSDEKYCKRKSISNSKKTCAQVARNIVESKRIGSPLNKAKERARNRAYSNETCHPGTVEEYKMFIKELDKQYKKGEISEEEYIEKCNSTKRNRKGENK